MRTLTTQEQRLYQRAYWLSLVTIGYNVLEGVLSIFLGYQDEALTLMGFGIDSFIEVLSGIGIAHMVWRIGRFGTEQLDRFEQTALRITGTAFYLLTAGLILSAGVSIATDHHPNTTFWGIVISALSLITMGFLIWAKLSVGKKLQSEPIIADARCTLTCLWMSVVLFASSGLYELFHIGWLDSLGLVGLAFFSFREGQECFEKARARTLTCCGDHCELPVAAQYKTRQTATSMSAAEE